MEQENENAINLVRNMVTATVVIVLIQLLLLFMSVDPVEAQTVPWCDQNTMQKMYVDTQEITNAVLENLQMRTDRDGNSVYVGWCRSNQNRYSCEANIESIVSTIVFESVYEGVDPWIIAAITWKETRFSAFAVGGVGERGVMQLHPRNSRFNHVRFLHGGEWYRNSCRQEKGLCQGEVIREGVQLFADSLDRCQSVRGALTMYNTGKCDWRGHRYATRVKNIYEMLTESI